MRTQKSVPQSEGWFVLPEKVSERELDRLIPGVRAVSRPVLDSSNTVHIRWKDAAAFARRLLAERPRTVVRMVGLDEYCIQILRFAWSAEAWELFELVTDDAARALGEERFRAAEPAIVPSWVPDQFWMPCMN